MSLPKVPRVRFVVQPTVSHYRAPLLRRLVSSGQVRFDLFGRYTNGSETKAEDRIATAADDVLKHVTPVNSWSAGPLRWEVGVVGGILRGGYDAAVLEGRVYTVSTWAGILAGRLSRTPVYLWGHGWKRPEEGVKRWLRLAFYKFSDGLLVYGHEARARGILYGLDPERIRVVGNSIYDSDALETAGETSCPPRTSTLSLVLSARLTPRHRFELLAAALSEISGDLADIEVHVIGDGSQRAHLEEVFRDTGVAVTFHGAVYDFESLKAIYAQCDVAVSPRASGLNIVQAMGFGLPVIAPAEDPTSGPESELVVEGETGHRFRLDDAAALRKCLEAVRQDPERRRLMGVQARESVLRTHTATAHAAAIESAILDWLASR